MTLRLRVVASVNGPKADFVRVKVCAVPPTGSAMQLGLLHTVMILFAFGCMVVSLTCILLTFLAGFILVIVRLVVVRVSGLNAAMTCRLLFLTLWLSNLRLCRLVPIVLSRQFIRLLSWPDAPGPTMLGNAVLVCRRVASYFDLITVLSIHVYCVPNFPWLIVGLRVSGVPTSVVSTVFRWQLSRVIGMLKQVRDVVLTLQVL